MTEFSGVWVPIVTPLRDDRVDRPAVRRLLTDSLGLFLATRTRWHKRSMGVVTNLAPGAAALLEQTP